MKIAIAGTAYTGFTEFATNQLFKDGSL